jgi:hypothetical protein
VTKCHIINAYVGREGKPPCILKFETIEMGITSIMFQPHNSQGKCPSDQRLDWHQSNTDYSGQGKNLPQLRYKP